uniref:Uncharacterized protein n=1 Tax=Ditylenchus dipsaci TaxID=166011 RepID=A0A915DTC1_9BILA
MSQLRKIELEGEDVSGFLFTVGNRISVQRVQEAHSNEESWAGKSEVSYRDASEVQEEVANGESRETDRNGAAARHVKICDTWER